MSFSIRVVLMTFACFVAQVTLAGAASKPGTSQAVETLKRIDPGHYLEEPNKSESFEALKRRLEQHYRSIMLGSAQVSPKSKEVVAESPDLSVMADLLSSTDGVGPLKVRIAQQIVSGAFSNGLPSLDDWPELPEFHSELASSENLQKAFWELPLDLVTDNKGRVNTLVCNRMNFVLLWGIYAGFRRSFVSTPKNDSIRDQWARLIVTLDVGIDFQGTLGRACGHSLGYARYLWGDSLTYREFNVRSSSYFSSGIRTNSESMMWFEDQEEPYVIKISYDSSDAYVNLGTLRKSPPSGNWNLRKPQRSRGR